MRAAALERLEAQDKEFARRLAEEQEAQKREDEAPARAPDEADTAEQTQKQKEQPGGVAHLAKQLITQQHVVAAATTLAKVLCAKAEEAWSDPFDREGVMRTAIEQLERRRMFPPHLSFAHLPPSPAHQTPPCLSQISHSGSHARQSQTRNCKRDLQASSRQGGAKKTERWLSRSMELTVQTSQASVRSG
jgi:hypothetical protein